jgi:hypothetical protein
MACKFYNLEKQHYARMQEADHEKVKRNRCAEVSDCKNGLPARPPLYQNVRQPDHAIAPGV